MDWIKFWAERTPTAIAIIDGETGERYTYQQINEQSAQYANYFEQSGIQRGDRVAVLMNNSIDHIFLLGAAFKLGFVIAPLNYRLTAQEVRPLIRELNPALVIVEESLLPLTDNLSVVEQVSLRQKVSEHSTTYPSASIDEDDLLFILYTSGSSGQPKGVTYTYKMMLWNSINTQISLSIGSNTRTVSCMPMFHTGGWNVLLTPLLHTGGSIVLHKRFDSKKVLTNLSQYKCTVFMAVPTMLRLLTEHDDFDTTDLTALDYIIVGGEAMPLDLIRRYHDRDIMIRQGYGLTEVGPNLTSLHHSDAIRKMGSIGKPNMYVDCKLVNPDGQEVGPGERGELVFTGNIVTPGYWQNQEATKKTIRNGWLHTGDIATMDEDGDLYIVDRIKNMYISGGENVYPAQVETVLNQHPAVLSVAIVGVPHEKWGEVGAAYLVTNGPLAADDLKAFCSDRLAKYKIPKHFIAVDQLPLNSTGKIDRRRLKTMWEEECSGK